MISVDTVHKSSIRSHYQLGSLFYRLLWGRHIHHGLWLQGDESIQQAQEQLTDTLADLANVSTGDALLDVGCGLGGSSIHLAKQRGCHSTGITLSPVQRRWAAASARWNRLASQTEFLALDADQADFPEDHFDIVWSIECTEHLFDKPGFFRRVGQWLKPGGRLAICVWFEGEDATVPRHREQVEEVCHRFVCPSLATPSDYKQWIEAGGLRVTQETDWTDQVARTWEICQKRVARFRIRSLARLLDREQVEFIDGFEALLNAYRTRAMQYGAIVAEKPVA